MLLFILFQYQAYSRRGFRLSSLSYFNGQHERVAALSARKFSIPRRLTSVKTGTNFPSSVLSILSSMNRERLNSSAARRFTPAWMKTFGGGARQKSAGGDVAQGSTEWKIAPFQQLSFSEDGDGRHGRRKLEIKKHPWLRSCRCLCKFACTRAVAYIVDASVHALRQSAVSLADR